MFKKEKKRKDSGISTEENSVENGGGKNSKRSPERKKRNRMSSGGSVDSRNDTVSSGSAEMSLAVANTSRNCTTSSEASPVRPADLPTAQTSGDQQTRGGQFASLEPRLYVPDFVSQLWRKIGGKAWKDLARDTVAP